MSDRGREVPIITPGNGASSVAPGYIVLQNIFHLFVWVGWVTVQYSRVLDDSIRVQRMQT